MWELVVFNPPFDLGIVSENEILRLNNFESKSSLSFKCVADNGIDKQLRKSITVFVSGKQTVDLFYFWFWSRTDTFLFLNKPAKLW